MKVRLKRYLAVGKGQIKRYIMFTDSVFLINKDKMNSNTYISRQPHNRIDSVAAVSLDSLQLLLLP